MTKKECSCCGKKLGFLAAEVSLKNGELCRDCWDFTGYGIGYADLLKAQEMNVQEFMKTYERKRQINPSGVRGNSLAKNIPFYIFFFKSLLQRFFWHL